MNTANLTYDEMERYAFITGQQIAVTADELDILDASQFTNEYERVATERVGIDSPEQLTALLDDACAQQERNKDLKDLVERLADALEAIPERGPSRVNLVNDLNDVAKTLRDAVTNLHLYSGGVFSNNLSLTLTGKPY